jgi:cytoskeletal protein CcmA (bactofilin family)
LPGGQPETDNPPALGARIGTIVAVGFFFGAAVGFLAGLFLAIPAAEFLPGGRPVIFGSVGLGALLGAGLAARRSSSGLPRERSGNRRVVEVVSRLTFKRGGQGRPSSTTPVWRSDMAVPSRKDEVAEGESMAQRDTRDYSASTSAGGELNALLGKGSEFEGKLAFEGKVRIDGTFTGEISTNDLLQVGDGAKVQAEISCGTVIVEGEITGNIKATQAVELRRPAKVHGDITTPSLVIEKGVLFEGKSHMESVAASNVVQIHAAAEDN